MHDVVKIVCFLLWVNSLPPIAALIAGERFGTALDRGRLWRDGRPLFGSHKTIRGVIAAVAGGTLISPAVGLPWWAAGCAAALSMAGDLLSSFIKRRAAYASGRQALILDQVFESLFPLLFLNAVLRLDLLRNILILVLFITVSFYCSRLWLDITERPLPADYPRTVRSTVRFHEWRTCHEPLARWHAWFNLTSFLADQVVLTWFFKLTGLYRQGERNALEIRVEERTFHFDNLPEQFDGFRVLFLTDLHLDGLEGLDHRIEAAVRSLDADLCCIGGDIRMKTYGSSTESIGKLKALLPHITAPAGTLGVLGNHDCIEMLPDFEEAGVVMLVNDAWPIEKDGARIWVAGVDDPHFYRIDDAGEAMRSVPEGSFTVFLAHSPEAFERAAREGADLYLCGHTHGGQVCLTEGVPLLTNSRAPRFTAAGSWRHRQMQGYTSRGAGTSGIPVRFRCPGEISLLTLRRTS